MSDAASVGLSSQQNRFNFARSAEAAPRLGYRDPGFGPPSRVDVLGVHVSVTDPVHALSRITAWVADGSREYICVSDVNALLHASGNAELRDFYNRSGMTLPDGMPLVWAGRMAGCRHIDRVSGPDLLPRVLATSTPLGWKHYFLGGAEGVAQRMVNSFLTQFPGLQVVGVECPPFRELSESEKQEQIDRINDSGAHIVWIGLGAPKQEWWMAEFRPRLRASVLIGVGAAFDFHAGDLRRAPLLVQRAGLEWAFRLSQEPRRLWRRYALGIPRFVSGIIRHPPQSVVSVRDSR